MTTTPDSTDDTRSAVRRAAVIGAGAMGTIIAAVLGASVPVVLVSRNEVRAAQIFKWGARLEGLIEAESRPIIVSSVADIPNAGGASLLVVATKTSAIPALAPELKAMLPRITGKPEGPTVISFQNGIDPGRELIARLDHQRVLRMVLSLGASPADDGRAVRVSMNQPPHAIGSIDPELAPECERIARLLSQGGLETEYTPKIETAVWAKGILNAAMNPVAALVNCSIGEVMDAPSAAIVDRLLREAIAVAEAEGILLEPDYRARAAAMLESARQHTPSMVEDIRKNRESEIGQLNRQIIEHGRRLGVPTPTHETIDELIETFDWKVYRDRDHA